MTKNGSMGTVGASGELAARVEEWQFSLGEGPCREAYTADVPVMVGDLGDDPGGHVARWPIFKEVAHEAGVRAMFAFPLQVGAQTVGVLDLFRDRTGLLSSEQVTVAAALAALAGVSLHQLSAVPIEVLEDSVSDRSAYRFEVYQASGMVSVQLGISTGEALVRLRARAFAQGRAVSELAADVIRRRIRFTEGDP